MSIAPLEPLPAAPARLERWSAVDWRRLRIGEALAGAVLLLYLIAAVDPGLLASGSPTALSSAVLKPPSMEHLFGTDQTGRDLFTRVVYGTRESLLIGLGATAISMSIAIVLGLAAGLGGRVADSVIGRVLELLFAFPVLVLALLLVAVFKAGIAVSMIAVAIGTLPGYARLVRAQVLTVRNTGYVEAARSLGRPRSMVVLEHIFPNAMRPLGSVVTLGVAQSIIWASGLAFLGLGAAPPSSEWGALLNAGSQYITNAWWLEVMPGAAIVALALCLTVLGRALQREFEGGGRHA